MSPNTEDSSCTGPILGISILFCMNFRWSTIVPSRSAAFLRFLDGIMKGEAVDLSGENMEDVSEDAGDEGRGDSVSGVSGCSAADTLDAKL